MTKDEAIKWVYDTVARDQNCTFYNTLAKAQDACDAMDALGFDKWMVITWHSKSKRPARVYWEIVRYEEGPNT